MPKMKSNRAAAKRFKRTANGGFKSGNSFTSHRFHGKTKKQRRQLRGLSMMDKTNVSVTRSYYHLSKLHKNNYLIYVGGFQHAS